MYFYQLFVFYLYTQVLWTHFFLFQGTDLNKVFLVNNETWANNDALQKDKHLKSDVFNLFYLVSFMY